jgi:hypothetical protein
MSTSSPEGIHANRSVLRARGKGKKIRAISGHTSEMPFARFDPDTHSWRTCEDTSLSASEQFSGTWPPSGILRNGKCYPRQRLARHIVEKDSLLWPTPTTQENEHPNAIWNENGRRISPGGTTHSMNLADAVRLWPTPTTNDARQSFAKSTVYQSLTKAAGASPLNGRLNPTWVEWLMGFPLGHTDLEHSATE